jgi:hypothetical protein
MTYRQDHRPALRPRRCERRAAFCRRWSASRFGLSCPAIDLISTLNSRILILLCCLSDQCTSERARSVKIIRRCAGGRDGDGRQGYDLDYACRAVGEVFRGAAYYLAAAEAGEPPGTWWGPGAERLGFTAGQVVEREPYKLLFGERQGPDGGGSGGLRRTPGRRWRFTRGWSRPSRAPMITAEPSCESTRSGTRGNRRCTSTSPRRGRKTSRSSMPVSGPPCNAPAMRPTGTPSRWPPGCWPRSMRSCVTLITRRLRICSVRPGTCAPAVTSRGWTPGSPASSARPT